MFVSLSCWKSVEKWFPLSNWKMKPEQFAVVSLVRLRQPFGTVETGNNNHMFCWTYISVIYGNCYNMYTIKPMQSCNSKLKRIKWIELTLKKKKGTVELYSNHILVKRNSCAISIAVSKRADVWRFFHFLCLHSRLKLFYFRIQYLLLDSFTRHDKAMSWIFKKMIK